MRSCPGQRVEVCPGPGGGNTHSDNWRNANGVCLQAQNAQEHGTERHSQTNGFGIRAAFSDEWLASTLQRTQSSCASWTKGNYATHSQHAEIID